MEGTPRHQCKICGDTDCHCYPMEGSECGAASMLSGNDPNYSAGWGQGISLGLATIGDKYSPSDRPGVAILLNE